MSHKKGTTDNGKEFHLYSRIGMYNDKLLSFFNADGSEYDFSEVGVEIGVKKNRGDADFVTLTEGSGITITDNNVHFVFDEEQSATFKERPYYWQFRRTIDGNQKVWLNGDHDWHNGKFDAFNDSGDTITITENGEVINIVINDSGLTIGLNQVLLNSPSAGFQKIEDLGTPTAANDAATKGYVDNTRVSSAISTATLTPDIDNFDLFILTAQAEALTIANPTGTAGNGNGFMIDIDDDGTARAITFGSAYSAIFVALPTTTIAGKRMKMVFQYNSTTSKYELLNVINEI